MTTEIQSTASWTYTLKTRRNHLTTLLKMMDIKPGKATKVQILTVNSIKAEISHIETQLKSRQ
jgi:hypothetical protein